MTPHEVAVRVAEIRGIADDDEAAHTAEDQLYLDPRRDRY